MPDLGDQRWSCRSCGDCCRTLVGHLTNAERRRIEEQGWRDRLGVEPYVRLGRGWALNKRAGGACVFLDEANRCRIHAEFGESSKPLACRIFPFSVHPAEGAWRATLRFDCPSVIASHGDAIATRRRSLDQLVQAMPPPGARDAGPARLQRGITATRDEVEAVVAHYRRMLSNDSISMVDRVVGGARISSALAGARFKKVRGDRLVELLGLLFGAVPGELGGEVEPPTSRQEGLLRQVVFAHTEHVSLDLRRASIARRTLRRARQLRDARSFLSGRGAVPAIPGIRGAAAFERVESATASSADAPGIEELIGRYLRTRMAGRSVFGSGYYGWPIFTGFAALFTSIAAVGWLSRYVAAADGRSTFVFDDVARALGMVDRAATRLPALGTMTERARMAYLSRDDGVARLVRKHLPFA